MPHLTQTPAELAKRTIVLRLAEKVGPRIFSRMGNPTSAPAPAPVPAPVSFCFVACVAWLIYYLRAALRVQLVKFLFKNNSQKSVKNNQMRELRRAARAAANKQGQGSWGLSQDWQTEEDYEIAG